MKTNRLHKRFSMKIVFMEMDYCLITLCIKITDLSFVLRENEK